MNQRIKDLAKLAQERAEWMTPQGLEWFDNFKEQFTLLIVKECGVALSPMLRDMVSRGQAYDLIKQHFGVAESSAQAEQEAAAFIAAEDKKVASRYGYVPKLHPSEWKD
jgi:hypothetical protein